MSHVNDDPTPVMIVGQGRSGTTLLASILHRHPRLTSAPETYFWRDLADYEGGWDSIVSSWPRSGVAFFEQMDRWGELGLSASETVRRLARPPADPGELFQCMCDHIAEAAQKARVVEKTPSHIRYIDAIRRSLPTAKIIHLVRDGRAVSLSRQRLYWMSDSFTKNMYEWTQTVSAGRRRLAGDPHAISVRYEDLVLDPSSTIEKVCSFIGEAFDASILEPDGSEGQVIERNAEWKQNVTKNLDRSRVEAWAQELSPSMQAASWAIAGRELRHWGYPPPPAGGDGVRVYLSPSMETDAQGLVLDDVLAPIVDRGGQVAGVVDLLKDPPPHGPAVLFLTDTPLTWKWHNIPRLGLPARLYSLRRRLNRLRRRGVRLVWVYHGEVDRSRSWGLLARVERLLSQYAEAVLYRDEPPVIHGSAAGGAQPTKLDAANAQPVAKSITRGL